MGRTAKYTEDDILDAALALVAEDGARAASVSAIARRLGAPSGSIYHRFASRDLILATLWIRTVRRFQEGFLAALAAPDTRQGAIGAVEHTVTWALTRRHETRVLAMYRREDLMAAWPGELGAELASLNDAVREALVVFARRHLGATDAASVGRVVVALIEIPYAAARYILRDDRSPAWLLPTVVAASLAALDGVASSTGPDGRRSA